MMESSSSLRTPDDYNKVSDLLEEGTDTAMTLSKTYGINNCSLLNKLEYFHVCNFGLPADVMHDLLEGCVPYTMKLLLNQRKIFYFRLSKHLNSLFRLYTRNKPNCLTANELVSEGHGLNQSGTSSLCVLFKMYLCSVCTIIISGLA